MVSHLRKGLETQMNFYVKKLLQSNQYTQQELSSLTISELANLYKKTQAPANNSKESPSKKNAL